MSHVYTDEGRDYFENVLVDASYTETIDTVAVGDGDSSPNTNDTALDNLLYESDVSSSGVTIEAGSGTGEIRATIEFTGGNEVPADSDIVELGLKASDGTLLYRELRSSAIDVASGETKIVEIRAFIEDADTEPNQTITTAGLNEVVDISLGTSSQKVDTIAVGDGNNDVSASDTTMQSELYEADNSSENVIVSTTGNVGSVRAEITISAGPDPDDEVASGSEISEFGLFGNGTLILHETRPAITLEANDTKTFKIPFTIIQ